MPYTPHPNCNFLDSNDQLIQFQYECWKDINTGEGIVAVQGATDKDHLALTQNRTDLINGLKEMESLDSIRYLESQGNGRYTELSIETNDAGNVTSAIMKGSGLGSAELHQQGQHLLDQEHENNVNLSIQEIDRTKSPPGHDL